jgi:Spy/CpxP family protein refolding chaperone
MGGKLKAASVLVLMFALGVVSGIAWEIHAIKHAHTRWMDVDRRIARLNKELHLTAWQQQAIRDIITDAHERAKDVHESVTLDMAQIHEDSVDAIEQLLTPEQRPVFEALHQRHAQHFLAKGSGSEPGAGS